MSDYEIYRTAKVVNAKLEGLPRKKFAEELVYFEGKAVEVIVRRKKKYRSHEQNKLYWVYMKMLGDYLGYSKDEIHSIVKFKFLKVQKVDETTGEIFDFIKSTTKLSTTEFSEYIEQLYRWSAETFGVMLPPPNSQIEIELK